MKNNEIDELVTLKERINELQKKCEEEGSKTKISLRQSWGLTIAIEIVASVITGVIVGVFLDKLFATKPVLLLVSLIISIIACVKVLYSFNSNNSKN